MLMIRGWRAGGGATGGAAWAPLAVAAEDAGAGVLAAAGAAAAEDAGAGVLAAAGAAAAGAGDGLGAELWACATDSPEQRRNIAASRKRFCLFDIVVT